VKWYFELKNLSLENALALRCPLSVKHQKDLRQYYSQYFVGLLAASQLFLDKEYPNWIHFKKALEEKLSFDGFPDGQKNYSYLRELRNSIIHRGLDISSSAHVKNDFPLLISPSPVTNQSGAISYSAFGFYLIEVIEKCENVIGEAFLSHFEEFDLLKIRIPHEKVIALDKKYISDSIAMPEWAKVLALDAIEEINYEEMQQASINSLVETLKVNVLSQHVV